VPDRDPSPSTNPATHADVARDASPAQNSTHARRRFLRAGLIAVPAVMTIRSRPAYAQLQSLGTLGLSYGFYAPDKKGQWHEARRDPTGHVTLDPNGPDRRPGTGDEPSGKAMSDFESQCNH
jgi:hypothetical protein